MGNICRSPAGEGVMQDLVNQRKLEASIAVDSAGTHGYHVGERADARMRSAAKKRGYVLQSRSRRVTKIDLQIFDVVIAMDKDNLFELNQMHDQPTSELKLLSDYLPDGWPKDVPDPYYGGDAGFEKVLDMIELACPIIVEELMAIQN